MKKKTIAAIIARKFDAWVGSIQDSTLKELVKDNTICTGGAVASLFLGEPPNDFDFYFRNQSVAYEVARYYVDRFKAATNNTLEAKDCGSIFVEKMFDRVTIKVKSKGTASEDNPDGYQYFEMSPEDRSLMTEYIQLATAIKVEKPKDGEDKPKYRPVFLSRNAITLSDDIQLIIRFYGEPDQIHENYDFVHCCNYWASWQRYVTTRPEAVEALLTRELRYVGSKYPLCSLFRIKKFVERGWKVNAGTILKVAWNLQSFNLNDIATLEEQLTGVDVAYFMELIAKLREKNPDAVDGSYLMQLIDNMF